MVRTLHLASFMMERYFPDSSGNTSVDTASPQQICGVVQRVDVISRELEVRLPAETILFDVPVDCPVMLHGERIKLRMVQNGDHVAITFLKRLDSLRAHRLEVQPTMP